MDTSGDGGFTKTNLNDYVNYLNPCIECVKQAATRDPQCQSSYNELVNITQSMERSKEHLSELVNQNVLFIFGNHDCGKSTVANAFLNRKIIRSNDKGLHTTEFQYKNQQMFKIKFVNEEPCSYTEFAPATDDKLFYLVEYPYPNN